MNIVYIPQLNGIQFGGGGTQTPETPSESEHGNPTMLGYKFVDAVPVDGKVELANRTLTRVVISTPDPVLFVLPPFAEGELRDLLLRIEVAQALSPEIDFVQLPNLEPIQIEYVKEPEIDIATDFTMIFAFTETGRDVFSVSLRPIDTFVEITFDTNLIGQLLEEESDNFNYFSEDHKSATIIYKAGTEYGYFPTPFPATTEDYEFIGWFSSPNEDGTEMYTGCIVTPGVQRLYAHWKRIENTGGPY